MSTEGPSSPGTMAEDSGYGSNAWSNVNNAKASDNSHATAVPTSFGNSRYLKATNFGFSITSGATIGGITCKIERKGTQSFTSVKDKRVRIVKGGSIGTTDKADTGTAWPTSDATATYGSSSDLWGDSWTDSDINASTFGFVVACGSTSGAGETASVDHMTITIDYTEASSGSLPNRRRQERTIRLIAT